MTALGLHVGDEVRCLNPDRYLRTRHGVTAGATIGRVAAASRCSPDDDGFLIDWGEGGTVRCDLQELTAVKPSLCCVVIDAPAGVLSLVRGSEDALRDSRRLENKRSVARYGTAALCHIIEDAVDAGYTVTGVTRIREETAREVILAGADDTIVTAFKDHPVPAVEQQLSVLGITLGSVELTRAGSTTTVTRRGEYIAGDDHLFATVMLPRWEAQRRLAQQPRRRWWRFGRG